MNLRLNRIGQLSASLFAAALLVANPSFTSAQTERMPKRMAVLRELLPSASRHVILYNPENVSKPPEAARNVERARELGLDAKAVQFRTAEDIERAFSAFATNRRDALVVLTEQR